jgi:hypothetical protein
MKKTTTWLLVALAAGSLAVGQAVVSADWKSKAAKKAVGEVAEEALENAVEDAVKDAAFNTAMGVAVPDRRDLDVDRDRVENAADRVGDANRSGDLGDAVQFGGSAAQGIETAMEVADFAQDIDRAMDVADKAKKANKIRKVVR